MTDLPPGWEWTTLGEIADTSLGKMLDKGRSSGQHLVPYLRNLNVQWGRFNLDDVLMMDIPPDQRATFEVHAGDLLVCEGGEIGRCAIWPGTSSYIAFQKALHRVKPLGEIDARYLRHLLEHLSINKSLHKFATGSTIKHLPQQQLRQIPVPLPPLAEQRRIVATLEAHLSRLDAGVDGIAGSAAKITFLVDSLRERALLTGVHSWGKLGDVLEKIEAGRSFAAEGRPAHPNEWGVVKVSAMTWGEFKEHENKALFKDQEFDPKNEICVGDILISRANTEKYVGAPVRVRRTRPRLLLSDKSLRLIPLDSVDPEWLLQVLASPIVRRQVSARATGTKDAMRNISQSALRDIDIPIAPTNKQRPLARSISSQVADVRRLADDIVRVQAAGQALHRSLLNDAFAGQLVPQDPDDEPASLLLERINAERAAQPKAKRTLKTTPAQETLL